MSQRIAIIGATGRLGRALCRQLGAGRIVGVARHPARGFEGAFVSGDARDVDTWRRALAGADAAVHMCAMTERDGLSAARGAIGAGFSGPLVNVGAIAARIPRRWGLPEPDDWRDEPPVNDDYGRGKRAAAVALERGWPGAVTTLLLPGVLVADDPHDRLLAYAEMARGGDVLVPGSGRQRVAVVTARDVAAVIEAVLAKPARADRRALLQVAAPEPCRLFRLVEAVLRGAGLPTTWRPHPDRDHRGPHSGGEELVQAARLHALLPGFAWDDPALVCEEMGRRWSARAGAAGLS